MKINRRNLLAGSAALAALPCLATDAAADEVPAATMPEGGIILLAQMTARPGEEAAVREALTAMVAPTRKEEGCLCYNLHVSTKNPAEFMFYEQWASQEALAAHGKSAHMKAMREAIRGRTEKGGATRLELIE